MEPIFLGSRTWRFCAAPKQSKWKPIDESVSTDPQNLIGVFFLSRRSLSARQKRKPAPGATEAGTNPPKVKALFGVTGRWRSRWWRRSLLFGAGRNAERCGGQSHQGKVFRKFP